MTLTATIQNVVNGIAAPDLTQRATKLTMSSNEHGYESCSLSAPLSLAAAFQRYDRPGLPNALITDGAAVAFQGRVEDTTIHGDGIDLTALGYSQVLKDVPYTAMWSVSGLETYRPQWNAGTTTNRKWTLDTDNATLNVGLVKNSIYALAERGELYYQIPNGSARQILGISFDFAFLASANVTLRCSLYNAPYTFVGNAISIVGTGALQTGSRLLNVISAGFSACDIAAFGLEATTAHVYAGETGAEYATISNIRIVTIDVRVSTTMTVARTNGAGVTITVGSTANMYVGQRIILGAAGGNSESVIVLSIPSGTTFTATVINAPGGGYPIGTVVRAFLVYADEIAKDVLSSARAANPTQLNSSTALIQSPGIDLLDETYEDQYPADIFDYLVGLGDTHTPLPRRWTWGVYEDQKLFFAPEGTNARAWFVDISDLELQRTIANLVNSAYAVYQDANGIAVRSPTQTDTASVARYGLTRRQAVESSTTNASQATTLRDTTIVDGANPPPRFGITFDKVYNAAGAQVAIWLPRPGDTITIRNLSPTVSVDVDRLRTFRIARSICDLIARTLTVEPIIALPHVSVLLAIGVSAALDGGSGTIPSKRRAGPLATKSR